MVHDLFCSDYTRALCVFMRSCFLTFGWLTLALKVIEVPKNHLQTKPYAFMPYTCVLYIRFFDQPGIVVF